MSAKKSKTSPKKSNSKFDWIDHLVWPEVKDSASARWAVQIGAVGAALLAAAIALMTIASVSGILPMQGVNLMTLLDSAVLFICAAGIKNGLRSAAIGALAYYLLAQVLFALTTGAVASLTLTFVFALLLLHGVRGTLALHRLKLSA